MKCFLFRKVGSTKKSKRKMLKIRSFWHVMRRRIHLFSVDACILSFNENECGLFGRYSPVILLYCIELFVQYVDCRVLSTLRVSASMCSV